VTYVNKKGERLTYPLGSALESTNMEMTKRLKYTKDILTHMLNNHGTNGAAAATGSTAKGSSKGISGAFSTAKADPTGRQVGSPRTATAGGSGTTGLAGSGSERKFYQTQYKK
jgi:hypothetical protein